MKKTSFLFLIIIGIFAGNFHNIYAQGKPKGKPWPAPETAVKMKNPVKSDESSIAAGKDIWGLQCKSCHGTKGKGDGTKAGKIEISCGDFSTAEFSNISDGELFWKTTEGRKPMPAFSEKLSDTERWQVINYVRTFSDKKKSVEPEKSIPLDQNKSEKTEKKTEKTKTDTIKTSEKVNIVPVEKIGAGKAELEKRKTIYQTGNIKITVWEMVDNGSIVNGTEKSFVIEKQENNEVVANKFNETELLQLKALIDSAVSKEVIKIIPINK